MPEISRFYGLVIKMFFKPKEHEPPHIHALYGEYIGILELSSWQMIEGDKFTNKNYYPCGKLNY